MGGRRRVGLGWAAGSGERRGWDVAWAWIWGSSINNGVGWVGVSCEGPGVGNNNIGGFMKIEKSRNLSWKIEDFRWEWPAIGVVRFLRAFKER